MKKKILSVILPLLCVLCSLVYGYVMHDRYAEKYVKTYVASHHLAQRTRIEEKDLEETMVPDSLLKGNMITEKEDLIGKYVRLSCSVPSGSFFYRSSLESEIRDLSSTLLMKGQMSYDIFVNEVRVNTGNLQCDMYTDIYLTVDDRQEPISDLLIRNCRIIGMYDPNGRQILPYDRDSKVQILTLALEPEDITVLNKALHMGEITVLPSGEPYQTGTRSTFNPDCKVFSIPE